MEDRIKPGAKGYAEPIKGKTGTYRLYFSLGKDPKTGRYLRSSKRTYHCRSKNPKNWPKELENALATYRKELEGGSDPKSNSRTLSDYASDFHALRENTMGSPLAYDREGYDVRHIKELFGDMRLKNLRPDDIRHAYAQARKSGRFSESEIRRIHVKLKQIMQDAMDNELVDRNPCNSVKLPKANVEARKSLSADDASRLLSCLLQAEQSPGTVCTMLLLECGLRKGEALGLSWGDYDTSDSDMPVLHIVHQYTNDRTLRSPKSRMSRRTIAVSKALALYLDRWKTAQETLLTKFGIAQDRFTPVVHAIGIAEGGGGKCAIITRLDGHNYSRWFRDFCVDNGFGTYGVVTKRFVRDGKTHIRGTQYNGLVPHALRHTQATLLIGGGSDIKTVQARLGHASPSTTLSIYAHAIEANDRIAAEAFDQILDSSRGNQSCQSERFPQP